MGNELKLPFSGLRAGILTQLIFLIIAAMLLVNVAMVKFSERDLIHAKVRIGRLLITALGQNAGHLLTHKKRTMEETVSDPDFKRNVSLLLETAGFPELVIIDQKGHPVFTKGLSSDRKGPALSLARKSLGSGIWNVHYSGSTWGVIWINNRYMDISTRLLYGGRTLGAVTVGSSLIPIYQLIRKSEKLILFYILLDTIILAIVGIYLLSRIVVKPIHKLLRMTEEYKDGAIIPSIAETSRNEIGRLSRSLSFMLKRLDENKNELKAHISSLEKANRELKQAQHEIIRSEKLASVGRLTAGIAHEIGNPIGIILGYLEIIRKDDITDEERKDFLGRVESEISRVNLIINQLLDFSRPSTGEKRESHAHELIMDTVSMLKPQPMMDEIRIDLQLSATNDTIFIDPNQLQQVFLNIIVNAADAIVGKDLPGDEDSPQKKLTIKSEDHDDFIEIRFIDNGSGIPEKELDHIFDPFYTTKEPGRGTGLGLSVCYRIIEGFKGTIKAESSLGDGTTIIISFPLADKRKTEAEKDDRV